MKYHVRKKLVVTCFLIFFLGMMMIFSLETNNNPLNRADMNDLSKDSELMSN